MTQPPNITLATTFLPHWHSFFLLHAPWCSYFKGLRNDRVGLGEPWQEAGIFNGPLHKPFIMKLQQGCCCLQQHQRPCHYTCQYLVHCTVQWSVTDQLQLYIKLWLHSVRKWIGSIASINAPLLWPNTVTVERFHIAWLWNDRWQLVWIPIFRGDHLRPFDDCDIIYIW